MMIEGANRHVRQERADDLDGYINSFTSLQGRVNDPTDVLGDVIRRLRQHAKEFRARATSEGRPYSRRDLYDAIMVGAVERVRPKMMTVVAIMGGLLPIMWSTGTGSEVMQRIAVPMIGGMVSSTLLTLIVIPAVFGLLKSRGLPDDPKQGQSPALTVRPSNDARRVVEPAG